MYLVVKSIAPRGHESLVIKLSTALLLALFSFPALKIARAADPNFGYEIIGANGFAISNSIQGSVFTIPEAGTADSITAALSGAGSTWTGNVKCAIYKHSDLSLVGSTEERGLSLGSSAAWYTFNFAAPKPGLSAGTEYVLVAWANTGTGFGAYIAFDSGSTNQGHSSNTAYGSWPNPLSPSHNTNKYSIYCSYTTTSSAKMAFVDGGSVAIGTSTTTLATLPTSFSAGDNFVITIVQLDATNTATISAGALYLERVGGSTLMSNFYIIYLSSATYGRGRWCALMGIDTGAGASPSYAVKATASSAVVSGEAKILAIGGVSGAQAASASEVDIGSSETTLVTLSTSLPAGDNVVLAISQTVNTGNKKLLSYMRLMRSATLAECQFPLYHGVSDGPERMQVQLIPYPDASAPDSPTYTVTTAEGESGSKIKGVAKIVAFSKGSLSTVYSDGGSTGIGTSETAINALSTSFTYGSEVAVIASEQFATADFDGRTISAGYDKLQQDDQAGSQTSNQYLMNLREGGADPLGDHGKGFGLLNCFSITPENPEYEVKATASDTGLNGESKILALCVSPPSTNFESVDGGSVAIGTGETTIATLSTSSFGAGKNFIIAIVQFSSTASTTIAAGNLRLTRSGTTLRSNQYAIAISSTDPHKQKWFALMAFDFDAPQNPSYDMRATAAATGISGEAKILAIGGLAGSSAQGSSTAIGTSETTLATLSTSLPAGDNFVLAIMESQNTVTSVRSLSALNLKRGSNLATAQYYVFHTTSSTAAGAWQVQLIPYFDVGAPASAQYTVTATAGGTGINGRATIVAFGKGSLSAAYSDGVGTTISTSETAINALSTSFLAGSEVAVIASEQFWNFQDSYTYINADLNKLQQNNQATGQTTNQYTMIFGYYTSDDNGKGFGLLNRFTSTPSAPEYEVKATKTGSTTLDGEAKILALCKPPKVPEFPLGPALVLVICFPILFVVRGRKKMG